MKLKTRLLCYTAAAVLSASAAFAAIDGQSLADQYMAEGYTYVEVTVGTTQTKVEAVKGDVKVEVVYDNETQEVIRRSEKTADAKDQTRTGTKVRTSKKDSDHDGAKGHDDKDHDGSDDDSEDDDDDSEDDDDDSEDDDEGDDD